MIHRPSEMHKETREKMRGGAGSVNLCFLEKEHLPANGRLFARLTLAPGCSIGAHEHQGEAELFYFVSGEGVVTDDGVRIPIHTGDAMTTLSGHSHSVENTGCEDLVLIAAIIKD